MTSQGADPDALLQLMQKEAEAGKGSKGLGRGVHEGETIRLIIWKCVQNVNPF